jgi:rhodanese-related sulfurtransferase
MAAYGRIGVDELKRKIELDPGLLVVNGYDDPQKWADTQIDPAISWMEFAGMQETLPKDREIVLYCA